MAPFMGSEVWALGFRKGKKLPLLRPILGGHVTTLRLEMLFVFLYFFSGLRVWDLRAWLGVVDICAQGTLGYRSCRI